MHLTKPYRNKRKPKETDWPISSVVFWASWWFFVLMGAEENLARDASLRQNLIPSCAFGPVFSVSLSPVHILAIVDV